MEVGEIGRKEPQVKVPWIPTTLFKPVPLKPVPIYTPGEINHMGDHANRALVYIEFSLGNEKICGPRDGSNVAGDGNKTCEQTTTSDAVSSYSKLGFREHLFAVEAESRNSSVSRQGKKNDRLKNQFFPSFIFDTAQDPQETYLACGSKRTSQDTPFTLDNANKEESRQIASMQINMEEEDPRGEERNVPGNKPDNNVPPNGKELCDPVVELDAVSSPFKENHHPAKGRSRDIDLNETPEQKPKRRKHRGKLNKEDKHKRTQKSVTPKPVQSKENLTVKKKYVRRKGVNKTYTPPTEVRGELTKEKMSESAQMSCSGSVNFVKKASDQSYAVKENSTVHLGSEIGVVMQKMNVGLGCDLNTPMKQASSSYMSLTEDTRAPNSSPSRRKSSGTKPEEIVTRKNRYVRRKGVKKTFAPPTEVTGELTKEKMPESAQISCTGSVNFDEKARDQSYAIKENPTVHPCSEIVVLMQKMNLGLACDLNTYTEQASNSYMSLPEDPRAPNTSPSRRKSSGIVPEENPTEKRRYVRRKRVNKTSVPLATSMKQASNSYMSLPEDTQAANTSPSRRKSSGTKPEENPTVKRKYVRKRK